MINKDIKTALKGILILCVVIVIFGYSYFRFQDYLNGPQITILNPQNGELTQNSLLIVQGQTKNISDMAMNGRKIFTDKDGIFTEKILLLPGHNIITVEATDKFKKILKKRIEIIYQET